MTKKLFITMMAFLSMATLVSCKGGEPTNKSTDNFKEIKVNEIKVNPIEYNDGWGQPTTFTENIITENIITEEVIVEGN